MAPVQVCVEVLAVERFADVWADVAAFFIHGRRHLLDTGRLSLSFWCRHDCDRTLEWGQSRSKKAQRQARRGQREGGRGEQAQTRNGKVALPLSRFWAGDESTFDTDRGVCAVHCRVLYCTRRAALCPYCTQCVTRTGQWAASLPDCLCAVLLPAGSDCLHSSFPPRRSYDPATSAEGWRCLFSNYRCVSRLDSAQAIELIARPAASAVSNVSITPSTP